MQQIVKVNSASVYGLIEFGKYINFTKNNKKKHFFCYPIKGVRLFVLYLIYPIKLKANT